MGPRFSILLLTSSGLQLGVTLHGVGLRRPGFVLHAVTPKPWGDAPVPLPAKRQSDDPYDEENQVGNPDEPTWLDMFPSKRTSGGGGNDDGGEVIDRDYPDFANLKPDDPLFLDMPWPKEAGPEASAFAKHMQWRRRLSDGERTRWQKWAIYSRLLKNEAFKNHFQFSAPDYVMQSMQRELQQRALANAAKGNLVEAAAWDSIAYGFAQEEAEEAETVVQCYYSALNRLNFDELKALLLPDEETSLVLPGYDMAVGFGEAEALLKRTVKEAKPFGSVQPRVLASYAFGYTAVVHCLETVDAGSALKIVKRNVKTKPSRPQTKRVLTTFILRKFNKQFRVVSAHSVRVRRSNLLGDRVPRPRARLTGSAGVGASQAGGEALQRALASLPDGLRKALGDQGLIEPGLGLGQGQGQGQGASSGGRKGANISNAIDFAFGLRGNEEDDDDEPAPRSSRGGSGSSKSVGVVDPSASVTKQAVQAVRLLRLMGHLDRRQQTALTLGMVRSIVAERTPLVEVAYELLVLREGPGGAVGDGRGSSSSSSSSSRRGGGRSSSSRASSSSSSSSSGGGSDLVEDLDAALEKHRQRLGQAGLHGLDSERAAQSLEKARFLVERLKASRRDTKAAIQRLMAALAKGQGGQGGGISRKTFERRAAKIVQEGLEREFQIIENNILSGDASDIVLDISRGSDSDADDADAEAEAERRMLEFRDQCLSIAQAEGIPRGFGSGGSTRGARAAAGVEEDEGQLELNGEGVYFSEEDEEDEEEGEDEEEEEGEGEESKYPRTKSSDPYPF